jgi:hypothetical protein
MINTNKKSRGYITGLILAVAVLACKLPSVAAVETPTPALAPADAAVNIAFKVIYETTWFCGDDWRLSFKVNNQGNANIESVYYSAMAPHLSFINYGTVNNAPFESTTTESEPACAQPVGHGQSFLAPGDEMTVPININPIPAGTTDGSLYIEVCSEENRSGVCTNQTLYFNLTP